MIALGSWPSTRLRITAWLFGWAKATLSDAPMPKFCQLITAFWLDWVTVSVDGAAVMLTVPATTTPPVGRASAPPGADRAAAVRQLASRRELRPAGRVAGFGTKRMIFTFYTVLSRPPLKNAQNNLVTWNQN